MVEPPNIYIFVAGMGEDGRGHECPLVLFLNSSKMIEKKEITAIIQEWITNNEGYFLVDVEIKPGNSIVVEIDNIEGVDISTCSDLSQFIESRLNRDVEDYELEVGSAGLTAPFKVLGQYLKNIGNEVEVLTKNGQKLTGVLKSADDTGFTLAVTKKVKPEGSKKKIEIEEGLSFQRDEIKYIKYLIRFK